MSDKTLQERLRYPDWWMDDTLNEEAADALDAKDKRIAELEARSKAKELDAEYCVRTKGLHGSTKYTVYVNEEKLNES